MGANMTDKSNHSRLADLRHDLCTPINQIMGYSEMLEEDAQSANHEFVGDLQKIQRAATDMLALVRERLTDQYLSNTASNHTPKSTDSGAPPVFEVLPGFKDESLLAQGFNQDGTKLLTGKILVVDDNAMNVEVLAARLTRQGHIVSTAFDGEEALQCADQEAFDLVLLDVMMPKLDGYSTLRALKAGEQTQFIPVIMISALDELDSVVRCIEAGAEDYLAKPFNPTLLRARVEACLKEKNRHDREVALYQSLLHSQQVLELQIKNSEKQLHSIPEDLLSDPRVIPVIEAFSAMTGALRSRESDLRVSMESLEIKINRSDLQNRVGSIVSDPSFSALSQRAKAMRARRRSHGESA
jgi:sigma-B regulation protein RsbU (phosphoserine phosphatase)